MSKNPESKTKAGKYNYVVGTTGGLNVQVIADVATITEGGALSFSTDNILVHGFSPSAYLSVYKA
jgi:hypothetical protein